MLRACGRWVVFIPFGVDLLQHSARAPHGGLCLKGLQIGLRRIVHGASLSNRNVEKSPSDYRDRVLRRAQ